MSIRDLERRRIRDSGWRAWIRRLPPQVSIGALAVVAIVLALAFRSVESSDGSKANPAATRPTATAAAIAQPTSVPSPSPRPERIHVVASGDTLTSLAQKYYGDASKWNKIFEANRDVLPSSNSLQIGQKLKIPE